MCFLVQVHDGATLVVRENCRKKAAAVWFLPPIGGLPELMLDAGVGGLVYAAVALTLNAAGVRDVALRLIRARRSAVA